MLHGLRKLQARTVLVHKVDGTSLRGVVKHIYRDSIWLVQAKHLDENADLDGLVVVPRERVDFWQVVAP